MYKRTISLLLSLIIVFSGVISTINGLVFAAPATLFSDGFESNNFTTGQWANNGCDIKKTYVKTGKYAVRLNEDNSLTKSKSTKGYSSVQVQYARMTNKCKSTHHFIAEWYNGTTWSQLENLTGNSSWAVKTFTLPSGASNNANFKLRFRTSGNGNSNCAYLDDVKITGSVANNTPPTAPKNLHTVSMTGTTVNLAWGASTDDVGVTGYNIYRNGINVATVTGTSYQDRGLLNGTKYTYYVKAKDASNRESDPSNILVLMTNDTQAPTAPMGITLADRTDTSITISWLPSKDNIGVMGYQIDVDGKLIENISDTTYTVTELTPDTSYNFILKAKDAAGNMSGASMTFTAKTLKGNGLAAPTNLKCTNVKDTSVTLSWIAPNNSTPDLSYDIYEGDRVIDTVTKTTIDITRLRPSTTYVYKVKAKDSKGNESDFSKPVSAVTAIDVTNPSAPTYLMPFENHNTSVVLSWTAATDNAYVAGYEIFRGGNKIGTSISTMYKDSGLTKSTAYMYSVRAYDRAGNKSEMSNLLSLTTLDDDHGDNISVTTRLELGEGMAGAIEQAGDMDFFSYMCNLTGEYIIQGSGTAEAMMYIYDGNNVCLNQCKTGKSFQVVQNMKAGGYYYIGIKHTAGYAVGAYSIKVVKNFDLQSKYKYNKTIAGGWGYGLEVRRDGTVWAWGDNWLGQLGDGTDDSCYIPEKLSALSDIVAVAASYWNSAALKMDGTIWTWGINRSGQLGDGTTVDSNVPEQVEGITGVTSIAIGEGHMIALKKDGTVWTWGRNYEGQLGYNTESTYTTVPAQVQGLGGIIEIDAGPEYSLALKNDGTVWAWGDNSDCQLGDGTNEDRGTPMQVQGLKSIIAIEAAEGRMLALKGDGTVWTCGSNGRWLLGIGMYDEALVPTQIPKLGGIVAIAGTDDNTFVLGQDGLLKAWGWNFFGNLCDGTGANRLLPVKVIGIKDVIAIVGGDQHILARKTDGSVWALGDNSSGAFGNGKWLYPIEPTINEKISDVIQIAAGADSTIMLKRDGTIWGCGTNYAPKDYFDEQNYFTPAKYEGFSGIVQVSAGGDGNFLAVKSDGTVWTWVASNNPDEPEYRVAGRLEGLSDAKMTACGDSHLMVLKNNGTVWTWGNNEYGQLGYPTSVYYSTSPAQVGIDDVKQVAAGYNISACLKNDGTVWVWGYCGTSQIKNNIPIQVKGIDGIMAIACGYNNIIGLRNDGTVWQMSVNYPPSRIEGIDSIVSIVCRCFDGNMAIKNDGTVWVWDWSNDEQRSDYYYSSDKPVQVQGPTGIVAATGGLRHAAAVDSNGKVWMFGDNYKGQLGFIHYPEKVYPASFGPPISSTNAIAIEDKIYKFGGNDYTINSTNPTNKVQRYIPASNRWVTLKDTLTSIRWGSSSVLLDNKIYIMGGVVKGCTNTVEAYDPTTGVSVPMSGMNHARMNFGAAVVDGKIYTMGGVGQAGYLDSIEVYDPAAGNWTLSGSKMTVPKAGFATAVVGSKIYVIGGDTADGKYQDTVEVYDTTTGQWSTVDKPMATARTGSRAEVLNGKIYVFGGFNGNHLDVVEIYDPATNIWREGPILITPRADFGTAQVNGKFYIIGGVGASGCLDSVEEYLEVK